LACKVYGAGIKVNKSNHEIEFSDGFCLPSDWVLLSTLSNIGACSGCNHTYFIKTIVLCLRYFKEDIGNI